MYCDTDHVRRDGETDLQLPSGSAHLCGDADEVVQHRLQLYWGVSSLRGYQRETTEHIIAQSLGVIRKNGLIESGDLVVFTCGDPATNERTGEGFVTICFTSWKRNNMSKEECFTNEQDTITTLEKLREIEKEYPTPFHIYDEKGIRENAKALKEAFAWNPGYKEYFAVKATPNPFLIQILKEYGCGCDCSSMTELMMAKAVGCQGDDIMFSSNETPADEYQYANEIGAIINLDDITHIDFLEKAIGKIPKKISCRYNPGGVFKISNDIMDIPGTPNTAWTKEQILEAFKILKSKGAEEFGIHAFLASNTVTNEYYPMLAKVLFELAVELKEKTGAKITFINLSGGIGIPYRPDQEPNDIRAIGEGVRKVYEECWFPQVWAMWLCVPNWAVL